MTESTDRPFDWIAALAIIFGAAAVIPGIVAVTLTLIYVVARLA